MAAADGIPGRARRPTTATASATAHHEGRAVEFIRAQSILFRVCISSSAKSLFPVQSETAGLRPARRPGRGGAAPGRARLRASPDAR